VYDKKRMANKLSTEKQIACIGALAEGASIRSIERLTGIHGDTIGRLAVRVGNGCAQIMDEKIAKIQMDEIWGFIGKKQANVRPGEDAKGFGDVWTFVAIDADTRMVPAFRVGNRDGYTANAFVGDVAGRLNGRVQVSTDGLTAYRDAIAREFGGHADYGQIVKSYTSTELGARRYSPPEILQVTRRAVFGNPDYFSISTSYIERQNLTMRMHMRRLTRLTNAFSKKLGNFKAAVALHFAYYNFVRVHKSLRMTPAMAGGVSNTVWTIGDLVAEQV
jgi:IS1 family transposase